MANTNHAAMQRDHTRWCKDHAMWLEDIDRWQAHHRSTLTELKSLHAFVDALYTAVCEHGDTIAAHELVVRRHAQVIPDCPGEGAEHDAMSSAHPHWGARHAHVSRAHEKIRAQHDAVAGKLQKLIDAINNPYDFDQRPDPAHEKHPASERPRDADSPRLSCSSEDEKKGEPCTEMP